MKCEKGHDSHICNDCGVCGGCAVENSNALASVTKRVEELEQDYESSRKELYAQAVTADSAREAAEAKLATYDAEIERLRDAIQLEISQRHVDDSYGRDKSACQTVSDILERRGNDFGLMSALAARKETP